MPKITLLSAHMVDLPAEAERFDTLISPSGTVASLNSVARDFGIDSFGFDYAYPNPGTVREAMFTEIDTVLRSGGVPVVAATALVYNVKKTLDEAQIFKAEFGDRLKFILGGQLVPFARDAYARNISIDAVVEGDAEALLPEIFRDVEKGDLKRYYSSWLRDSRSPGQFTFSNYDNFFNLEERMRAQREVSGFSQLCIQGVGGPGCSWAAFNPNGACEFCALQNITTMNSRSLRDQMVAERELQDKFVPDRLFDVANQFLPMFKVRENIAWLNEYIRIRKEMGVSVSKYAYLTVGSVNNDVAALLREAGVTEVYLGVDHFDHAALVEQNKSSKSQRTLEKALNALSRAEIDIRMGLVVGSASETENSLRALKDGVVWLRENYAERIKAVGVFPIYVLPGSRVYETVKKMPDARPIIDRFESFGYLSSEDEAELSRIYMLNHSRIRLEEINQAVLELRAEAAQFAISYDYRSSPDGSVLKR